MDKRMRELVEQAFLTVDGPETFKPSLRQNLIDGLEDLFQEFARLIAQECIQVIQNESMNSGDEWEDGLRIAEGAIREHFGVSE